MWVSHWLGTGGLSDGGFGYSRWKKERAGEPILTGTGRWSVARPRDVESLSDGEREKLSRLMSLPYLQGYKEAPEIQNVSIYDPKKAYDGLNLYTSGHGPEAILMDMTGAVLHRWHFPIENVWPDAKGSIDSAYFRRVHLFPNGDLLAIFDGFGMVKIDRDSKLIWEFRGGAHHQADVLEDGTIYTLTRRPRMVPDLNPDEPILEDRIAILNSDGELLQEYSVLDALQNSPFWALVSMMVSPRGDMFHTNTIYVLDGSKEHLSPIFKKGNILTSIRNLDTLAVIDLSENKVVWAASGRYTKLWIRQHDPQLLDSGSLLVFDNQGRDGRSKIIEINPFTLKIEWQYPTDPANEFFTLDCGAAARLPNGNTLIAESNNGRAFEITREGETVWEFDNPNRAGQEENLIATLFDLTRIEVDYPTWLSQSP